MATALATPTAAEILNLFPQVTAGQVQGVEGITSSMISDDLTNNPLSSVPVVETNYVKALLTAEGYDHTALDDVDEYPYAWNALRAAIWLRYLQMDAISNYPKEEFEDRGHKGKIKQAQEIIRVNLEQLEIYSSRYAVNSYDFAGNMHLIRYGKDTIDK